MLVCADDDDNLLCHINIMTRIYKTGTVPASCACKLSLLHCNTS